MASLNIVTEYEINPNIAPVVQLHIGIYERKMNFTVVHVTRSNTDAV